MAIGQTTHTESVLFAAVEIADPMERAAYLRQACGSDDAMLGKLERLVENHFRAGRFLEALGADEAATANQSPVERVGTSIGRYKLLDQIGEGGMGVVYMAEQVEPLRRRVALKLIRPGMDTRQVIARFEAERQTLAIMDHPGIARVLDAGETDGGRPYFVMELVRGVPITAFCDKAQLNTRNRLELLLAVCQAVLHAHQRGIIHRDLKPTNVLVTSHDGKPVPKVIDFGIAKAIGNSLTDKTLFTDFLQVVGTPLYMSPEQAKMSGLDVDTRSDVYSLGVLSYELLTGRTPFSKDELKSAGFDALQRILCEVEPLRPSQQVSTLKANEGSTISERRGIDQRQLVRVLNGELDWIVMKALEKDRNRRYDSVSALAADIQRYLNNEPVLASPPSPLYRFRKFARRRRVLLGFSGVAMAAVLLVMGVSVAAAWRLSERAVELDALNSVLSSERDSLEEVLLRVVAQDALSDALHDPTAKQDYRTRVQFASEALDDAPTSPTLHFLAATALNDAIYYSDHDSELTAPERELQKVEFSLRLASVLENWNRIEDGSNPGLTNALAWMLTTAVPSEVRKSQAALELSRGLCERYPTHSPYLNTLALAYFRAGRYLEAIDTENLALAQQDRRLGNGWPHIVLAMSHHKLDQPEQAARCLDVAETAMATRQSNWEMRLLFREAMDLVDRNVHSSDPVGRR
jgi:serine/threonine protein kinase